MQIYKVKNNQNIFDVALNIYGSIEGVFNLLANNPELSFSSILKEDDELYWDEGSAIYDHIVNTMKAEHIIPVNGERHVYFKETSATLRCVICVSPDSPSITLLVSGDGSMVVDWGDNSDLENILLEPTDKAYTSLIMLLKKERLDCMVTLT